MTTMGSALAERGKLPWWVGLALGICYVLLGLLLIFQPLASTLVVIVFIGAAWFISGVVDLLSLARARERWAWVIVSGVLGICAGLAILARPIIGVILLPTVYVLMLALNGLVIGGVRVVQGLRGAGAATAIWGAVTVLLSGWLLLNPLPGAAVLPFIFGAIALFGGTFTILAAWMGRG